MARPTAASTDVRRFDSPANAAGRPALPGNVIALGVVSLLMATSSQMIHGLLPIFLVTVIGASTVAVGLIEGVAEATNSLGKVVSGALSDWIGRRKVLVVFGYGLSAVTKPLFAVAGDAGTVLLARFFDRSGKGMRDAPRDALLADELAPTVRGAGYGLRLTLFTLGSVAGPLVATAIMLSSGGDMRLVFWIATIPALLCVAVLVLFVKEADSAPNRRRGRLRLAGFRELPRIFWWLIAVTAVLELARFSQAFLLLKAKEVGVDAAWLPMFIVLMSTVYGVTAYPFGVMADGGDRRRQLAAGAAVLVACYAVLAVASSPALTAVGALLWGLQMGITQGLLAASVADAAPAHLRGTAFGIYYLADGVVSLLASTGAGAIWAAAGSAAVFGTGGALAVAALALILIKK